MQGNYREHIYFSIKKKKKQKGIWGKKVMVLVNPVRFTIGLW